MRHPFRKLLIAVTALIAAGTAGGAQAAWAVRVPVIHFEAGIPDAEGLPYDGAIDVEAAFFATPIDDGSPALYREAFTAAAVEHGLLRLPLLTGMPLAGSRDAVISGASGERFVDIAIGGVVLLARAPLGEQMFAIRAEHAALASALLDDFKLTPDQIPYHPASKITSGILNPTRLPSEIPAGLFTAGTLGVDHLPAIPPGYVTSGVFSSRLIPDVLNATMFTTGFLRPEVLPTDVLQKDDLFIYAGTAGHLGIIPVPTGFARDQCQWVVGIKKLDGTGGVDQSRVYADQNGVVTCRWSDKQDDAELNHYCMASYLVICRK
jgi:hypothetical protein